MGRQLCCISTGGYAAYQMGRAARLHWMERQLCCISTGGYAAYRTGRAARLHIEWNGSCAAYQMNGQLGCTSTAYERLCRISNGIRMGIIWMAYRTAYWMAYRTAHWMAYWMAYRTAHWMAYWMVYWMAYNGHMNGALNGQLDCAKFLPWGGLFNEGGDNVKRKVS